MTVAMCYPGGKYEQVSEEGARFLEQRGEAMRWPPKTSVETFGPVPVIPMVRLPDCQCEGTCLCEDDE